MRAHGLAGPWAAGERLLACVHGGEGAAELVRYTKRLADRLKAPWTAIHVQTAADRRAGEAVNDRVADTLRLAERLGGETLVLPGERIAEEMLAWARGNNVTQIVIGSVRRSGWRDWLGGSLPRDLIRGADDIVVQVLPEGGETAPPKRVRARPPERRPPVAALLGRAGHGRRRDRRPAGCCRACSTSSNVALIFVVPVLAAALAWGLWPALAAAVLATLAYNFFFLDPLYTFADRRSGERRRRCSCSRSWRRWPAASPRAPAPRPWSPGQEAARAAALYGFAKKLTGVATIDDLLWAAAHQVAVMLKAEVVFLLPEDGRLALLAAYPPEDQLDDNDLAAARMVLAQRHAGRARLGQPARRAAPVPAACAPAAASSASSASSKDLAGPLLTPAERRLLDALLDQTALAVDRVQLARDVDETRLLAETERLRTALLTSIGHDLKTPLASILGTITALRSFGASLRRRHPRGDAGDGPGGGRAAGPLRRQPARHDPAGGRCARPEARAGRRRRRGRLGPAPHRPAARRPSRSRPTCRTTCRWCAPTSCCSSRCWSTCWRTPPATPRPARRSRSPAAATGDGVRPRGRRPRPRDPARRGRARVRPLLPGAQRGTGQGRRPGPRRRAAASSRPWAARSRPHAPSRRRHRVPAELPGRAGPAAASEEPALAS